MSSEGNVESGPKTVPRVEILVERDAGTLEVSINAWLKEGWFPLDKGVTWYPEGWYCTVFKHVEVESDE